MLDNNRQHIAVCLLAFCAAGCASSASKLDTDSVAELVGLADSAYQDRQLEEAQRLYLQVAEQEQAPAQVFLRLGNIAMLERNADKAVEYYTAAVQRDPRHPSAHYNLATVHLQRAEEHMNYYVALADDESDVNDRLVRLLSAIERFSENADAKAATPTSPLDALAEQLVNQGGR